ncbi:RDD family protein [Microbacterium gilvum]|uniref:RDD family protein n=1 Tax=Microbacterium gilvum TaxID=1336204 RepID=UPI0031EB9BDA
MSAARAAQLGLRPAPTGRRMAAALVDALPALVFSAPVAIAPRDILDGELLWILIAAIGALLLVVYGLVQLGSHGRRGQTFGKQLLRIRTVRADTLRAIGFWRAVEKAALVAASGVVPVVGTVVLLLSPLWDREKRGRGWHDRAARAWLIDLRAVDPFDAVAFEAARGRARARVTAAPSTPASSAPPAPAAPAGAAVEAAPAGRAGQGLIDSVPGRAAHPGAPSGPAPSSPARAAPSAPVLAPEAPDPFPPARIRVRLDTGEEYLLAGRCLIGRLPVAEPGEAVAYALPVQDGARSVSKTHFVLDVRTAGMTVTDRRSGNGTSVIRSGVEHPAVADIPFPVYPGDRIRFGDRTMEVLHG